MENITDLFNEFLLQKELDKVQLLANIKDEIINDLDGLEIEFECICVIDSDFVEDD